MVIEKKENIVKPEEYNPYWNTKYKFKINERDFTLKEYYDYAIMQEEEYFKGMQEFAKEKIPEGKFILFIDSVIAGTSGHPNKKHIDNERWEKMVRSETGEIENTTHQDFQTENMKHCLGLETNTDKLIMWSPFGDNQIPDLENCVGVVLSGSEMNLFEELKTRHVTATTKVKNLLKKLKGKKIPKLGICFGGQILAEKNGAKINFVKDANDQKTRITGIHPISQNKKEINLPHEIPDEFYAPENHEQQIVKQTIPKEIKIIAESEDSLEILLCEEDGKEIIIQFHPEVGPLRLDVAMNMAGNKEQPEKILEKYDITIKEIIFKNFLHFVGEYTNKINN